MNKSSPYDEGIASFERGDDQIMNPYKELDAQFDQWDMGFSAAQYDWVETNYNQDENSE